VTSPIASATSLAQLQQLVQATRLQLSAQDVAELNQASQEEGARD
jgi:aryl-alcohol dehydrogenase-like predicted oxidoreductase